jgi:hypothetical protein
MGALKPTVVVTASVAQGTTTAGGRGCEQVELALLACTEDEKLAGAGPRVNERETDEARPWAGVALALVRRAVVGPDMETGGVVASDDIARRVARGGGLFCASFVCRTPPLAVLRRGALGWWWRVPREREREMWSRSGTGERARRGRSLICDASTERRGGCSSWGRVSLPILAPTTKPVETRLRARAEPASKRTRGSSLPTTMAMT